jgi:hypothetical protein
VQGLHFEDNSARALCDSDSAGNHVLPGLQSISTCAAGNGGDGGDARSSGMRPAMSAGSPFPPLQS